MRWDDAHASTQMELVFFNMAIPEVEIELRHDGTVVAVDCMDFYCALAYGPSPEGMMSAAMKYFA